MCLVNDLNQQTQLKYNLNKKEQHKKKRKKRKKKNKKVLVINK